MQTIGRYEINRELGRGGMASVFEANDPRFGRSVAVKVLPREMLFDPAFRARFDREARTVAMLEHSGIVPVHDYGEQDGQPFIVMRYMPGGSLADRLKNGPLPIRAMADIFARIGPAIDYAMPRALSTAISSLPISFSTMRARRISRTLGLPKSPRVPRRQG